MRPLGVLFDLDGVIYQGDQLIPGARQTIQSLKLAGIQFRFITNTTRMTKRNLVSMLKTLGLSLKPGDIFAAPHAAVEYCKVKGFSRISLIVPDENMKEDFTEFQLVENNPDAIVIGDMGKLFTFKLLNQLFIEILNGAELVAMHKNRYWNSVNGLALDLGAFVSALEYATERSAAVMGKPNPNLFHLAVQPWKIPETSIFMVGDDLDSDIGGAQNAGMKSVLVKTGKFRQDKLEKSEIKPDYLINSVADFQQVLVGN